MVISQVHAYIYTPLKCIQKIGSSAPQPNPPTTNTSFKMPVTFTVSSHPAIPQTNTITIDSTPVKALQTTARIRPGSFGELLQTSVQASDRPNLRPCNNGFFYGSLKC